MGSLTNMQYLQLRHFALSHCPRGQAPEVNAVVRICKAGFSQKKLISQWYGLLNDKDLNATPHTYMKKWEEALGQTIDLATWYNIWENATKTPICENIYKILMGCGSRNLYHLKGCGHEGTLLHIFWTCPVIKLFWGRQPDVIEGKWKSTFPPTEADLLERVQENGTLDSTLK
ncbi:hypothetical protein XELAEV_18007521mg [Xenopus laevis]|uniref:Uncharacterized protein n=1 Tax=Xenopus laevis TaxID=8355 RepID=A0A974E0W8_XENLA|nr:hypothetical protein XELAEV_18007521mg [Xenopus laevis]